MAVEHRSRTANVELSLFRKWERWLSVRNVSLLVEVGCNFRGYEETQPLVPLSSSLFSFQIELIFRNSQLDLDIE